MSPALRLQEVAAKLGPAPGKKRDRTALGLGLYALSSCFLATMLMFAKKLGMALCIALPFSQEGNTCCLCLLGLPCQPY